MPFNFVSETRSYTGKARLVPRLAAAALASSLVGCASVSIPLGDLMGTTRQAAPPPAEIVTGSVPIAPASLTRPAPPARSQNPLAEDDAQTIRETLSRALLEQERAPTVPWLNARSGHGGTITPVGAPLRQGEAVCRAVLVSVQRGAETATLQGNACRGAGFDWSLLDLRPFQAPT